MPIVVVHSDPLLGSAVGSLIEREGGYIVSGVVSALGEALDMAKGDPSQILVVDDALLQVASQDSLKKFKSGGGHVAVLCGSETISTRAAAIADAVLSTKDGPNDLFNRLSSLGASKKGLYVSDNGAAYLGIKLSKREQAAAGYVARGMSNRDIAEAMNVSEQSVKNYLRRLMRKLDCKNRVQLLLKLSGGKLG